MKTTFRRLPVIPAACAAMGAVLLSVTLSPLAVAEPWPIESGGLTFRFAVEGEPSEIESRWPGSQPIDTAHHDLSFIYNGCGAGFDHAILRVPGTLLDPEAWHIPAVSANAFDASIFGPEFAFIGSSDGATSVWVLTQTSLPGTVFLGTSTEDIPTAARDEITDWLPDDTRPGRQSAGRFAGFELVEMLGPEGGEFSLYRIDGGQDGPTIMLSTAMPEATTADNVVHEFVGGHTHYFWTFTKPGLYELTFRMRTVIDLPPVGIAADASGVLGFVTEPFDVTCDGLTDAFDVFRALSSLDL